MALVEDPQHLGALPGMVGSLHTWGRSGIEHVHLHFLVTAGGWTAEGWRACPDSFFVPYKALRRLFRGKLLSLLRRALEREELVVPAHTDGVAVVNELNRLGVTDWHVRVMDRYEGGRGVLMYFSRYVRGGPVTNPQILRYEDGQVEFRYRDHESGQLRKTTVSAWEFIRRILEHVPEKGFRVVRHYGLFAQSHRDQLAECRRRLGMAPYQAAKKLTVGAYLAQLKIEPLTHCPVCDQPLQWRQIPRPSAHAPPPAQEAHREAA